MSVSLDDTPAAATTALRRAGVGGAHLFQPGGLDSPLAVQYGILTPPNLFLLDKEGKVVSRTTPVSGLEEEIKKLLK